MDTALKWLVRDRAVPLVVAVICLVLSLGGDTTMQWGRYDRELILEGEWWRLLTAHFVHLGWSHLALNLVALALLAALFEGVLSIIDWCVALGVSLVAIDAGFLIASPQIEWYVGLSGLLHGVTMAGALQWARRREATAYLLVAVVIAKVTWEQLSGPSAFSLAASGGPVVVDAHLYGLVGGVLAAAILWPLQRRDGRPL